MKYSKAMLAMALAMALEAQQTPRPSDTTSLEQSMTFLQEKLGAIGQVNFSLRYRDQASRRTWVHQFSPAVAKVHASAPDCRIDYDWRWVHNGRSDPVRPMVIQLKQAEEIEILPGEEVSREVGTRLGVPQFSAHADPPVFIVRVDLPGAEDLFPFYDEALARRVAAELSHAVELCGGHAPSPADPHSNRTSPPPGEDASLATTMKWIADTMEGIGPVNYIVYSHTARGGPGGGVRIVRYSAEADHVRASAPDCRIGWHARRVENAKVVFDGAVSASLRDTARVEAFLVQQAIYESDQKQHRPPQSYRVVPSTSMVRLKGRKGDDATFAVADAALAVGIAKVLSRAVDACGGGLERY